MDVRNKFTQKLVERPVENHAEAESFFDEIRKTWDASEASCRLRSILASADIQCNINKIVGFGLGPISYYSVQNSDPGAHRSSHQHSLILTVRDILGEGTPDRHQCTCYSQDPAYSQTDEALLLRFGIITLGNPKAFLEVDESTAVISCCPNVPVKQIVSDISQPALVIWCKILEDDTE